MSRTGIQKSTFIVLSLFAISFISFPVTADAADEQESQFVFATPPITKLVDIDEKTKRVDATYISIDADNKMTGVGVNMTTKKGTLSGADVDSWNIFTLKDEDNTMDIIMGGAGQGKEIALSASGKSLLFFLLDTNLMYMGLEDDNFSMTMMNLSLMPNIGFQQHVPMGNFKLTPYVTYAYNLSYSSYSTEIEVGGKTQYDSDSDTMTYGMLTIGFDIMIPGGISLASMLTSGADDDMTMIKLGYNF